MLGVCPIAGCAMLDLRWGLCWKTPRQEACSLLMESEERRTSVRTASHHFDAILCQISKVADRSEKKESGRCLLFVYRPVLSDAIKAGTAWSVTDSLLSAKKSTCAMIHFVAGWALQCALGTITRFLIQS